MRLLFVHDRFGALAGAEVNLYLVATELKQRGHTVALLHGPATGIAEESWRDLFPERFPIKNGNGRATTKAAIDQFEPEVIYVHKMSDVELLEALVDSGRPLVRMVHDHELYCMRSYKYHPLTRHVCTRPAGLGCIFPCGAVLARNRGAGWPLRWVSFSQKKREIRLNRRFHRMVVATEHMKQELVRNGFDPRRLEIHPPVPQTKGDYAQSSFSERNLVIYAGQLVRGKGVDLLLRALARVRTKFECLVLGDGNHRAFCEVLSRKLGVSHRVIFKGYMPPAQMQGYYSEASVAAVSSVWPEPFGAVGLEAMRYGLPVVAFDAGGIKEWLRDEYNGFLVPTMDIAQFAVRLEQLLENKVLARQMGQRGRELVREKFDFGDYVSGLEAMFARVAGHEVIMDATIEARRTRPECVA